MDSDTALTLGVIAVGGYAVYRLMNPIEKALDKTTDAVSGIFEPPAQAPAGTYTPQVIASPSGTPQITTPSSPLYTLNPFTAPQTTLTQMFNEVMGLFKPKNIPTAQKPYVDSYIPGAPNFTTTSGQEIFIDTSGKNPVSMPKIGTARTSGALFSSGASVAELTRQTSLKPGGGAVGLAPGSYHISGLGTVGVRAGGRGIGGSKMFPV